MMEGILNVVRREAQRTVDRATTWAVGTIDSYDKATHSAKVKLQPEGVLSGWLPLNSLAVGNSFGIHAAPKVGDPVLVHFHEADREAGIILGRFFTDKHPAVPVEEGEYLLQHEKKTKVFFKQDGTLRIQYEDKNTEIQFDADGQVVITQDSGAEVLLDKDGNAGVKPADNGLVYLGGLPGDGHVYDFVATVSAPAINVKARIG